MESFPLDGTERYVLVVKDGKTEEVDIETGKRKYFIKML